MFLKLPISSLISHDPNGSKWSEHPSEAIISLLFQWLQHIYPSCVLFFSGRFFLNTAKTMDTVDGKNPRRLRLIVTWLATRSYIFMIYLYKSRAGFSSINNSFPESCLFNLQIVYQTYQTSMVPVFTAFVETKLCNTLPLMISKLMLEKPQGQTILMKRCIQWTFETRHLKKLVYFRICPFLQQVHGSVIQGCPNGWFFGKPCGRKSSLIGQSWITKESRRAEPLFVELR